MKSSMTIAGSLVVLILIVGAIYLLAARAKPPLSQDKLLALAEKAALAKCPTCVEIASSSQPYDFGAVFWYAPTPFNISSNPNEGLGGVLGAFPVAATYDGMASIIESTSTARGLDNGALVSFHKEDGWFIGGRQYGRFFTVDSWTGKIVKVTPWAEPDVI